MVFAYSIESVSVSVCVFASPYISVLSVCCGRHIAWHSLAEQKLVKCFRLVNLMVSPRLLFVVVEGIIIPVNVFKKRVYWLCAMHFA